MVTQIPMPSPLNSPVATPLYTSLPPFSFSPPPVSSFPFQFPSRRRRFKVQASSLLLPLLPIPIDQVLVPSESKTLHLYEARYIALLEEVLKKDKLLVHFVVDQIGFGSSSAGASFIARYGCLATLERVEQLEIGALVSIRGVGRVKVLQIEQALPYLTGEVVPLQDNVFPKLAEINSKVLELKEALRGLNSLEIKLKAPGEALLQTPTMASLVWSENQPSVDCNKKEFIPHAAERVSFAALQPVSGASPTELLNLQRDKLTAMDTMDTRERLDKSIKITRNNIALVAAKLAIQSLTSG